MAEPVIAIFGPTGIGKTSVAIELAGLLRNRGEDPIAISVDSMQVYRELPIITGAPTALEQTRLEHRLVGSISVADSYDVATHAAACHVEIDGALSEGRRPLVVGGTGLYLRAALTDLDFVPPPDPSVRERLMTELAQDGLEQLYARLADEEPDVAATINSGDARRVVRALEAIEQGRSTADRERNRLWTGDVRRPTRLFALVVDREILYERIEARVDEMIELGAIYEVESAAQIAGRTAAQALGFDELLAGDIESLKMNTRRYAKRQLTWLRKLAGAELVDVTDLSAAETAARILAALDTDGPAADESGSERRHGLEHGGGLGASFTG
ncbi:MAG: tRNA (adenosine(37)-N6)-dimethylallyltransferase MiaA [Actinobacteria bacterium]|nr:tRNA (adenosine(37)-N6)-dimethylallyltransferase MiaA [Actinomycetota bacterium]